MARVGAVRGCDVVVEADDEGVVRCGDPAPYNAINWGHDPGSDEVHCCKSHAYDAVTDGVQVDGPNGHCCRIDDDGELYEEEQAWGGVA